jgi:hypothetical protein
VGISYQIVSPGGLGIFDTEETKLRGQGIDLGFQQTADLVDRSASILNS